jgi:hypothetical protein
MQALRYISRWRFLFSLLVPDGAGLVIVISVLFLIFCRISIAQPNPGPTLVREDYREQQTARALTLFDQRFLDGARVSTRTMQEIVDKLEEVEEEYLEQINERSPSYGIFAIGDYDYDLENDESRFNAGLEWRLFNDGFNESLREERKKVLQTQLEFYQLRRDMIDRQLEDDLYTLFTIENQIRRLHSQEKREILADLLTKRSKQARHGYTTESDLSDIGRQLRQAEQDLEFYERTRLGGLTQNQFILLNGLEDISLRPRPELTTLAEENSYNLKIQDNFIDRSEYFPSWTDDLALNVNAAHRREFDGRERQIVGFEVEIPLHLDLSRRSLIDTQKRVYRYQKHAVNRRLEQQIDRLCTLFDYHLRRLDRQQEQLAMQLLQIGEAKQKEAHSLQALDDDPARTLDLLTTGIIDSRYEALETRLAIYEVMLKLLALTQAGDINLLFEFSRSGFPDH